MTAPDDPRIVEAIERVAARLYDQWWADQRARSPWPPPEPEASAWRVEARVSVDALADMLLTEKTGDTA